MLTLPYFIIFGVVWYKYNHNIGITKYIYPNISILTFYSPNIMTGKDIKAHRERLGLNQEEYAVRLGLSKNTIWNYENGGKIPNSKIPILEREMKSMEKNQVKEDAGTYAPSLSKNGVPYYDVDFYGGFDFAFNDQTIQPAFMIDYAPYNDCDAWINVSGKSMSPFISHGDIAALKKLNTWQEFIPFGEIYAVLTEEHKTIKIVTAGKDDHHLTLVPYNKSREFVEQQIPKKLIHQMYRVKGSIKKFF